MTDQISTAAWRRTLGILPIVSRAKTKRMLHRAADLLRRATQDANENRERLHTIRASATALGRDHLPDANRLFERVRVGNLMSTKPVTKQAFCRSCNLAWPCPTYRLAHKTSTLTYGWEPIDLPQAFIAITFGTGEDH